MIKVLGIKIVDRIKEAGLTQEILSRYSDFITTRLGFHELTDDVCGREAYIILHMKDHQTDTDTRACHHYYRYICYQDKLSGSTQERLIGEKK